MIKGLWGLCTRGALVGTTMGTSIAMASGGGGPVKIVNWYQILAAMVVGEEASHFWWPAFASASVLLLIVVLGLIAGFWRVAPENLSDEELLPASKFGVRAFLELGWSVVSSTLSLIIGEKHWHKFAPVLGGTFFFILLCNLSGVVPGFAPATEQMNMTFAMGLIIFVVFNFYGFKYGGLNYIKHLAGPTNLPLPLLFVLPPLIFVIETISTFARPVSLSLRLFGNISGDHLVFSVFSTLQRDLGIPWFPLPVALLAFGTLVAGLQAFIFMTLSAVYVKLALDTGHHDDHH
jgi:F-type H+-transporting ATPase subunit a